MSATVCRWFARCENVTETALPHAVLGHVPCCARCAALVSEEHNLVPLADVVPSHLFPAQVCPCGGPRAEITRDGLVCSTCGKAV